ncbi:MAG TPA: aminomethyl-transferring glycine dehydrogenase subunit GcvPB [Armatimonadota bacterium]|nr:aminomethyl-transferring glycine dehydrogenase subunit GcvPB [Armatimonadota bacterium]HOJ20400.1 aminomethyl-transferring glycine dehydrogenase subunit GcvPB [Armatimonadota bacterium]HOM80571.1 aminomethyl-transferring glycine dehydrogenase subunit GcvPB [Armatimonadota bacterium]HPO72562.1 aminomethyl-transferring glycine dehydrogenase subunit GcvPB [Armatimonadota bacterium]HPT99908.1 aminomethyl-transferring glycine dehydrogenase subunit GcvPB [Armatimonadota bacterium]
MSEPLIFELSRPGRVAFSLPECDVPERPVEELIPAGQIRGDLPLPEVSEPQVVRHFTRLSRMNYGVDMGFYPLGSCTMKYNPRVNEAAAALPGFATAHPLAGEEHSQGALQLLYELQEMLAEIAGMDAVTLQPVAGAQGELTGLLMIRAYHLERGDTARTRILVPDSSHGTNPATAARCGYTITSVPSNDRGRVDLEQLRAAMDSQVAALMLTNPNTLGLFEDEVLEVTRIVHEGGGLVYMDGANMNAILGIARPGDLGFDVMHFNLHKTFSTPHGGGGPGAAAVAAKAHLEPYLPVPRVVRREGAYALSEEHPRSIGRMHTFYGNFANLVRAYTYLRTLGPEGLRLVAENAVLNANYLLALLKEDYEVPYGDRCMHEFVASAQQQAEKGVRALDIAKRLIDHGFHPPTMYFPLIVREALMIEPTETESIETLDAFAEAMREIAREAREQPEVVHDAPHPTPLVTVPVSRVDEVAAARHPNLRWTADE